MALPGQTSNAYSDWYALLEFRRREHCQGDILEFKHRQIGSIPQGKLTFSFSCRNRNSYWENQGVWAEYRLIPRVGGGRDLATCNRCLTVIEPGPRLLTLANVQRSNGEADLWCARCGYFFPETAGRRFRSSGFVRGCDIWTRRKGAWFKSRLQLRGAVSTPASSLCRRSLQKREYSLGAKGNFTLGGRQEINDQALARGHTNATPRLRCCTVLEFASKGPSGTSLGKAGFGPSERRALRQIEVSRLRSAARLSSGAKCRSAGRRILVHPAPPSCRSTLDRYGRL
jgi:hypothetical protein